MTLTPALGAVGGIRTGLVTPAHRADGTTVHDRPRPINLIVPSQPIEHRKVDEIPNTCLLPVAHAPPARHPRTAAQFRRQHLPREAAAKDKENAGKTRSIGYAWPSTFGSSWWNRQERLDKIPQRIWKQRGGHNRSRYLA
jgi:hypothetical protein